MIYIYIILFVKFNFLDFFAMLYSSYFFIISSTSFLFAHTKNVNHVCEELYSVQFTITVFVHVQDHGLAHCAGKQLFSHFFVSYIVCTFRR